jgi:hypothetical protein
MEEISKAGGQRSVNRIQRSEGRDQKSAEQVPRGNG